jgi:uncharacterized damage-inducible protein DinB
MNAQTLQSEMALDMRAVGEKYVSLAEAMPASAYAWRPAEGVRSVSEVFMHISAANMGLPASFMGVAPPEGYAQRAAFEHLASTLEGLTDEQLHAPVNVFGRDTNGIGAVLLLVTHSHEHLGQAIAYARSNGVTPPWSN